MADERVLLGPGPSLVPPEVSAALARPLLGHLDPDLLPILDEVVSLLRAVFQTTHELTLPVSGTGTAGMEAVLLHMVKPGDRLAVCTAGYLGDRLAEAGARLGAEIVRIEAPWGRPVDPDDLERALARGRVSCVAAVHVETSTGVLQPLRDLIRIAHAHDAMILVDAVASLGGVDLPVDAWEIDACYSGSQKCLSAPPGLAPVTVHARTRGRHRPATFYLDLELSGPTGVRSAPTTTLSLRRWSARCTRRCGSSWPRASKPASSATGATRAPCGRAWRPWACRSSPRNPIVPRRSRRSASLTARTMLRCAAGCCATTGSKSPAGSDRSGAGCGASA
ncbi:MAG: aminotransferase class V-fold PLP-dependent enzyme [Armatimonadota bacterium]|nr:aminotransferase class V-fold PLP-dependent enzyme [Armatimonadota bacterium]